MIHKSKTPVVCGVGSCEFQSVYATVVGRHRRSAHGVKGKSSTIKVRAKALAKTKPTVHKRTSDDSFLLGHVTFFSGYVTRAIEDHARGNNLPAETLARGVGSYLIRQTGR